MKLNELKEKLGETLQTSNEYPTDPRKRYSKLTYMAWQNIEDIFGKQSAESLKKYLENHPEERVVVLAGLTPKGRMNPKPRLFGYPESAYYGQYTLFAPAAHMSGFVEVFQNLAQN